MSQANSSLGAEDTPATYGKYRISAEERQRRIKTIEYAETSVVLSGAEPDPEMDVIYQQFIDGDLTMEECGRLVRASVGM